MKINLIIGILLLLTFFAANAQTQLSADEFENKLATSQNAQIIDVRTPTEFKDGHLKNASNIDYKSQAFKDEISKLDKSKPVFVYCLGGVRSAAAAEILKESGFPEVYDMKGGYLKWTAANKAVEDTGNKSSDGMTMPDYQKLTSSSGLVLIDFNAPWCAPCVKMLPTIHKLAKEYKGKARIETISYDPNKVLAKELGIDAIPAFLLYKDGKLIQRKTGLLSESDFRNLLDQNL